MSESESMPGAFLSGWSAFVVNALLGKYLAQFLPMMSPAERAEMAKLTAAVRDASDLFTHRRRSASGGSTRDGGSAETGQDGTTAGFEIPVLVTVSEAALLAGVSERRLRQLAARWAGEGLARKVGQAWLVDRTTVELYREQRRGRAA